MPSRSSGPARKVHRHPAMATPVRRLLLLILLLVLVAAILAVAIYESLTPSTAGRNALEEPLARPAAPPDLARVRDQFSAGVAAIQRGNGAEAVRLLSSFSFGSRAVEQYRLYYLSTAFRMSGDSRNARLTLARLLSLSPTLVARPESAAALAAIYASSADWREAADVLSTIGYRNHQPQSADPGLAEYIRMRFYTGDAGGALAAARSVMIENPTAAFAADSASLIRDLLQLPASDSLPFTLEDRADRTSSLLESGRPDVALDEINAIDDTGLPAELRDQLTFNKGIALQRLRRYDDSNKALEKLASEQYRFATPALFAMAQNDRALAASLHPTRLQNVVQRVLSGHRRVKGVVRPIYRTVRRTVKVTDLKIQAKQDDYARLESERLKDVIQLPAGRSMRLRALTALLTKATAANQDAYMRQLTTEIIAIDPWSDAALQWFWDHGWAAWERGDLAGAGDSFTFISTTYHNPNVRRQSRYWLARTLERLKDKEGASAIYGELAAAPFQDLYARFSSMRGAAGSSTAGPMSSRKDDWPAIADRQIPRDLVLAYELTALGASRDARLEVESKANDGNRQYADAIMGELAYGEGETAVALHLLKLAFPQLATVEQDEVPVHFVKMYYPLRYQDAIRKNAGRWNVDPYLVMALIHQESSFDPHAHSGPGARGLLQLMPATGREIGRKLHGIFSDKNLDDPLINIEIGTCYVRQLLDLFGGNVELATAAYNAGMGNVGNWKAKTHVPLDELIEGFPFPETRNYVKRIAILRSSYQQYDPGH